MTTIPLTETTVGALRLIAARQPLLPLTQFRLRLEPPHGDTAAARAIAAGALLASSRHGDTLSESLAAVGAVATASSDVDGLLLSVVAPADEFPDVLELLAQAATNRSGAEHVLEAAAASATATAKSRSALPETQALRMALRSFYPVGSAYAVEEPDPADLTAQAIDAATTWLARSPARSLVLVGAIDPDEAVERASKVFANLPAGPAAPAPDVAPRSGSWEASPRPGSVQTCFRAVTRLPRPTDSDRPAAAVLHRILGGSSSSRLARRLREEHGWSYHPGAVIVDRQHDSRMQIEVDVATEVTAAAFSVLRDALRDLRDAELPSDELSTAVLGLGSEWANIVDSQTDLADALQTGLDIATDPRPQLEAVTAADVQAAAARCLSHEAIVAVVAGEAEAADEGVRALRD